MRFGMWLVRLFDRALQTLFGKQLPLLEVPFSVQFACVDGPVEFPFVVKVYSKEATLMGSPVCAACTRRYLEMVCTFCGMCEDPILPGTRVAFGKRGQSYPYVHLTFKCCGGGEELFYGVWGQGDIDRSLEQNGQRSSVCLVHTKYTQGTREQQKLFKRIKVFNP
jgi:hypothetical protein